MYVRGRKSEIKNIDTQKYILTHYVDDILSPFFCKKLHLERGIHLIIDTGLQKNSQNYPRPYLEVGTCYDHEIWHEGKILRLHENHI